jgi:ATP-dependent Clp protease ATP-binding subunit ClpX
MNHRKVCSNENTALSSEITDQEESIKAIDDIRFFSAQQIKKHLDMKVIGQEKAKIQISVLLSMHMNWFKQKSRMHRSPNALIFGPTGVGKTHTLRIASEYLGVPFVVVDTTAVVRAGIVGLSIEEILADLIREAKEILRRERGEEDSHNAIFSLREYEDLDDIGLAQRGIIFLDEFDKVYTDSDNSNIKDSNLSIQRRLLKLTDGAILKAGERSGASSMDTSGILFVAGGSFIGMDNNKVRSKRSAEMQRDLARNPNVIISEDVINYGFVPELVARFPILIEYESLSREDLLTILENQSVSPIQVWQSHFEISGKKLTFAKEAKEFAAEKALKLKLGARGLQQVLFPALSRMAFEIESSLEDTYEVDLEKIERAWMQF